MYSHFLRLCQIGADCECRCAAVSKIYKSQPTECAETGVGDFRRRFRAMSGCERADTLIASANSISQWASFLMLEKDPLPDAQRYADEARALRALGEQTKSYEARRQLLGLAALYDKLAELVEEAALHTLTTAALVATMNLPEKESLDDEAAS